MRNPVVLALIVAAVAGCSGDPRSSRLSPGQEVMVTTDDGKPLFEILESGIKHNGGDSLWLNPGIKLRVVSDDDPKGTGMSEWRSVSAIVLEGDASGVSVNPTRKHLRPIR